MLPHNNSSWIWHAPSPLTIAMNTVRLYYLAFSHFVSIILLSAILFLFVFKQNEPLYKYVNIVS
jgi:hypothetical protein